MAKWYSKATLCDRLARKPATADRYIWGRTSSAAQPIDWTADLLVARTRRRTASGVTSFSAAAIIESTATAQQSGNSAAELLLVFDVRNVTVLRCISATSSIGAKE